MTPTPYSLSADKHNGDNETYPISMGPSLTWSDPATGMEWFIARFEDCLPDGQKEADIVDKLNSHARLLAELEAKLAVALRGAELLAKEAADQHRELDAVATTIEERTEGHAVVYSDRLRPHAKAIRALLATKEPDNK